MSDNDRTPGLGAAADMARRHLGPDDRRDLAAVARLRTNLMRICKEFGAVRDFPRVGLVEILNALAGALETVMNTEVSHPEITIVHEHPSTQLVRELAATIRDLDKGLVDARLKPENVGGTSIYDSREIDTIRLCLITMEITRKHKGITWKEAANQTAEALRKMGFSIRDRAITADKILGWKRQPPAGLWSK
jgi:hypothetical protein